MRIELRALIQLLGQIIGLAKFTSNEVKVIHPSFFPLFSKNIVKKEAKLCWSGVHPVIFFLLGWTPDQLGHQLRCFGD